MPRVDCQRDGQHRPASRSRRRRAGDTLGLVNPYAPPGAPSAGEMRVEPQNAAQPVSFWPRVGGRIIDTLVGFAVGFVGATVATVVLAVLAQSGAVAPGWAHRIGRFTFISLALNVVGTLAYHAASEGIGGASIGKAVLGMRVCRPDGSPCSMGGAVLRNIAYYVDGFLFGAVAYGAMSNSPLKQRLGDRWGNTAVFRAASVPGRSTGGRVMLGIGVGMVLWVLHAFVATLVKAFEG